MNGRLLLMPLRVASDESVGAHSVRNDKDRDRDAGSVETGVEGGGARWMCCSHPSCGLDTHTHAPVKVEALQMVPVLFGGDTPVGQGCCFAPEAW